MPVGRIILRRISESNKLSKLKTDGARLLYTWLIPHLDINGCYSGDAQVVNGKIFTRLKKSNKTIEEYLNDMENNKLIIRYQRNDDTFLHVPDFKAKQPNLREEREGKSSIPLPTPDELLSNSAETPAQYKISKDKLSKVKRREEKEKTLFLESVYLTDIEYKKLLEKHGEDLVKVAIEELNNHKMSKGIKYKSDYHAILKWAIDAALKKGGKGGKRYGVID